MNWRKLVTDVIVDVPRGAYTHLPFYPVTDQHDNALLIELGTVRIRLTDWEERQLYMFIAERRKNEIRRKEN